MHQEIGMYFWVIRITCPFKIITGQQGGKNLCSVVITKKLISIIFSLWRQSHIGSLGLLQSTSKSALPITLKVTVNSFNWIYVRPTGSVVFGQKSESIWIDQIHLGCLPRNLPSLILPTLSLYCLPEERNECSVSTDGNGKDHIVWWKVGEVTHENKKEWESVPLQSLPLQILNAEWRPDLRRSWKSMQL